MPPARYFTGLVTLALTVVGIVLLLRWIDTGSKVTGLPLRVEFRDAHGLRAGADVRYRGVVVGSVRTVQVSADGSKAVVELLLDDSGVDQACVNSPFWIVSPRFTGLTSGATGLDTLVHDAYVAFVTPAERGSALRPGSLLVGHERPPALLEPDTLEPLEHGDLLMSLLVPENHGLRPGAQVIYRGMPTGDVRSAELSADGSHVELRLRIHHQYRRTVTDKSVFWVARPFLSGALFSGFTVSDMSALLSPYISYYADAGKGVPVADGWRAAAVALRPDVQPSNVPAAALRLPDPTVAPTHEPLCLVRVVYAAISAHAIGADDAIQREGTGVLFDDVSGRPVVATARSLVDGSYTEHGWFGSRPAIVREQLRVVLSGGPVLGAGRVWVDPDGQDLAVLVLDGTPPDLPVTAAALFDRAAKLPPALTAQLRCAGQDGTAQPALEVQWPEQQPDLDACRGGALLVSDKVVGLVGQKGGRERVPVAVPLQRLPEDLRPAN
ncbi:MAG TPA: MlaD family protein [Planctomycetota bacterium]|nr:MlaD family protein [Planctomycetota bacterium]